MQTACCCRSAGASEAEQRKPPPLYRSLKHWEKIVFHSNISFQKKKGVPVTRDNPQILLSSFHLNYFLPRKQPLWKWLAASSVDYPVKPRCGFWNEMFHYVFLMQYFMYKQHRRNSICFSCTRVQAEKLRGEGGCMFLSLITCVNKIQIVLCLLHLKIEGINQCCCIYPTWC